MKGNERLVSLIRSFRPDSLLLVGERAEGLFADYLADHPGCRVLHLPLAGLPGSLAAHGRYDLAFVSGCLEHLDPIRAGEVIAALRDIHARRLLVAVPVGGERPGHRSHWEMADLLAYGLVQVGEYRRGDGMVHLYGFDIATYKVTPDWLNSRYWANPELWDRYWW